MNIPEEFGKYLLLKKLSEDPLGETFRAGKAGNEGIEQVVLLRVFNGKGLDGERLWQRVSGRSGVHAALRSPNIGTGVDLGRVRSFPYAAYDYISGKSLAAVFARAARQFQPLPADHALLIAERLSLALAAAHETRVQDERVLHGFVVPHLVMVSNEGETRLLGFEVAPGLRELAAAGWRDDGVTNYLSPEALAGAPLGKADDVYSLGAILFELLTGERLPAGSPEALAAAIDAATLPNEGTPLPASIANLLKKSLTARDQRIADAVTWHKTLAKLMIDGQFSPTTFNLAFFMHNLFREEIERETQEIQAEKKLELPPRPVAPIVAAAPPPPDPREATGVRDGTLAGARSQVAVEAAPAGKGPWIGLAAVAALLLAGGGWYFFGRSAGQQAAAPVTEATPAPAVQAALPGAIVPAAVPAGPTPEELQAQIQQMFEARSKEMEAKLKTQYDDRIKLLQQQLEDSKKGPSEQERQRMERQAAVPEPAPAPVETRPAATRIEPPAPAPQQAAAPSSPPSGPAVPPNDKPAAVEKVASASVPPPSAPAPAPVRQQPQVQFGDLVQGGAGVVAPKLSSRLEPRYPPSAQRLNRAAQVDIKVLVDERGKVMDTERIGAKAGFGFDEAAMDAARRASFQPATKEGVRVKMWTTLRVAFKPQ